MSTAKRLVTTVAGILLVVSIVCAQEQNTATGSRSAITVTAAATTDRVRFTAPSTVVQIRLEVYAANGEKLFDNETRGGNVVDWHLQDGQAERVSDGSYLCVITSKGLSGRISQKLGKITIENTAARLEPISTTQLTAQQTQAVGPLEENASLTVLKEGETQTATVIAHNGEEGQLVRGRGALSFRIGDFFSGKDTEQMRLTPEGNLGIGITHPRVRLDVDGLIRTNQGVVFPDGTIQTTAAASASRGEDAPGDIGVGAGKLFKATKQGAASGKDGKGGKNKVSPELFVGEDLTVNGNILFTPALARDISMTSNIGGVRIFTGPALTTSPSSAAIQFFGNGHAGFPGQAFIDSGANDSAAVIFRTTGTGGTIAERMRVTAAGTVGIGTTSPSTKLDVVGAINITDEYRIGGDPVLANPGVENMFVGRFAGFATTTGRDNAFFGFAAGNNNTGGSNNAFFGTSAGHLNLMGSRNAFFGTFAGLSATGSGNTFLGSDSGRSNTTEDNNTFIGNSTSGVAGITNATAIGALAKVTQSNSLVLGSINGVNSATSDTKVGIGISNPSAALHINAPSFAPPGALPAGETGLLLGTNGTSSYKWIQSYGGPLSLNPLANNVGIGTIDPASFKLQVSGSVGPNSDNSANLGSAALRWNTVFAANGTINTSDARLKQGIRPLYYGLREVMQMRPVTFQWKDVSDPRTHLGLLAQEVEQVVPEVIVRSPDASAPLGISYTGLIPLVIKAIQEQQATLDGKDAALNSLKAENAVLEARLKAIEQRLESNSSRKPKARTSKLATSRSARAN